MAKSPTEKLLDELDRLAAKGRISPEEYEARRNAIIAGNVAAPPEKKGGGLFKWGFLGCLGILAAIGIFFVILIVAIGAALNDATDDTPDSGGDVRVSLAIGASGAIAPEGNGSKKSKVTILQVVDNVPSTNQFIQPAAGKKWIGLEVEVENVGTAQVTSLDWTLRDTTDQEHERTPWTGAEGSAIDIVYHDLTPGGKKRGWIYFEVDQAAGIKWLRADPNPFLANDLYFDAP
ncbi:MAG: DUF4352 domain-containing protein [Chloroflexi bacterium]|nr:DUF4352 domain-containing protein [Dehalococcoidia bacterium]MCO5202045.1 DUF4352 domain-containing protein [Chloroflexota bacterium]